MIYVFGEYELDTDRYELRQAGQLCKLEPKVFDVLVYLTEHRDQAVTRQELLDNLWPDQFISDSVLSYCITNARKAVGDSGRAQHVIKTLHGRGYRFVATVEELTADPSPVAAAGTLEVPGPTEVPVTGRPEVVGREPGARLGLPGGHHRPPASQQVVAVVCGTLDHVSALTEQVGFDVVHRLRQMFFTLAQQEVQRYEGRLQFFGADSVLMLFGTAADHTHRAVRAALDLQQRFREYCGSAEMSLRDAATVRMGVHTGPVDADSLAQDQQVTAPATGETMHIAVWLQYRAAPGTLLTSEATMQLVHDVVQGDVHGNVRLPGQSEPITAYIIRGLQA